MGAAVGSPADDARVDAWVRRSQSGDGRATEALLRHFRPRIFRYCLARLGDREEADDVTQEAALALATAVSSYEDRGAPFGAFVFRIVANHVAMAHRSRARRREEFGDSVPEHADPGPGPAEVVEQDDDLRRLLGHLDTLPMRQREILLMRVVAGLDTEEVAAALDMTVGNVRVAQHRALQALRQRLREEVRG